MSRRGSRTCGPALRTVSPPSPGAARSEEAGRRRPGAGLTGRLGLAASVAAAVVVLVFVLLAGAISHMQRQTAERRESVRVRLAADALQKSVLDLETGVRPS